MVLHLKRYTVSRIVIYNSRNFVWFYTADPVEVVPSLSTIVEILYGFTPYFGYIAVYIIATGATPP